MKLLYASDYDSKTDIPLMFWVNRRNKYHAGELNGKYQGKEFKV